MGLIKPGSLCFDIGANSGQSLERFIKAGAGTVISVEACFENYARLLETIFIGGYARNALHAAVCDHGGVIMVSRCLTQSGLSTTEPDKWKEIYPKDEFAPPEAVACVTLMDLVSMFGAPHYIKIDVEGAEKHVIAGMGAYNPPYLSFEFHRKAIEDTHTCWEILKARGYQFATWQETEADLDIEPCIPMDEFWIKFMEAGAAWGNITTKL